MLLAGLYADDCTPAIRWLAQAQPEVAAQCLVESGAAVADRDGLLRELQAAWQPRLTDIAREPRPEARAAVGRALGRLSLDRRKGVGLDADDLPDIDWVEIPGGEFLYQHGQRLTLETFWIARYPITNAQFEAFVAAGGYLEPRWWAGLHQRIEGSEAPAWDLANHPRETVSWYEAMAFCAWLSDRLGRTVTLPTEQQWERAARSRDGREYPWGEGYRSGFANIDETWDKAGEHYLGRTSAVGIYLQGASPEGVLELAGNLWEWCLNEYEHPERTQPAGPGSRVVRGGSWDYDLDLARAGYRSGSAPASRSYRVGFRVVCVSPIR